MLRIYVFLWALICGALTIEYSFLNFSPEMSILVWLKAQGVLASDFFVTAEPGRPLSLFLGWTGMGLMVLMNIYMLRKRLSFMSKWGRLSNWLDFHIFCGLVGPTFIVFHCNFKVRGLVAISFWSMVVSLTSGIIGRYFYVQLAQMKNEMQTTSDKWWEKFLKVLQESKRVLSEEDQTLARTQALQYVGVSKGGEVPGVMGALFASIRGDINRLIFPNLLNFDIPDRATYSLKQYALHYRKALFADQFRRLMGYWHIFHLPFAVFMYVAAVIHIVSALLFGVSKQG